MTGPGALAIFINFVTRSAEKLSVVEAPKGGSETETPGEPL